MIYTSEKELFQELYDFCHDAKTQAEAAKALKVSPQYLSDMLRGNRALSPKVAKFFGYKQVTVYVPGVE